MNEPTSASLFWNKLGAIARKASRGARWLWMALTKDADSPLADLRTAFVGLRPSRVLWGLFGLILVGYLLTGVYSVGTEEEAVVRRFGKVIQSRVASGLHYRLPWPIDRVDIVNVNQIRRETVGVLTPEADHEHLEPPGKLQALSGDTNVVDIELVAQYQIGDPEAYLLKVQYPPHRLIHDALRAAVTTLVTTRQVETLLTTERQSLQEAILEHTQRRLDDYNSGLILVGVDLQKAFPPNEVAGSFVAVNTARDEKARAVNQATGYANSLIPEARGEAQGTVAEAAAYRAEVKARANGSAQAFEAVLAEYWKSAQIYGENVTRYRLYLEAMTEVLPRVQVYAVAKRAGGTVNLRFYGNQVGPFPGFRP